MKKLFITLLTIISAVTGFSQAAPCDPAQTGLAVSPSSIAVGQTANFTFSVYNAGSDPGCSIGVGDFTVVLSLPSDINGNPTYYSFVNFVSPVGGNTAAGPYFDWEYFPAPDNIVVGVNRVPLPNGMGEVDVTVKVVGIANTSGAGATSNLNIISTGPSNAVGNDASSANLIVANVLAAGSEISVSSAECMAKINWKTNKSDIGSNFIVEYSPDGVYFTKVASYTGKYTTGGTYESVYNQGMGKGYYRVKTIAPNGTVTMTDVVRTTVYCTARKIFIYPNPVQNGQNLNVNVTGYEGSVKGEMMTVAGQSMEVYQLKTGLNKIAINKLPEGTYNFKVTDDRGASQNYKVVVVK